MTDAVRALLGEAADRLTAAGVDSARFDAESLLAWVLGLPRERLRNCSRPDEEELEAFSAAVSRRASREPLQHITGTTAFRYLDLEVGPGVFTPRPETEVMTGVAVAELKKLVASGLRSPLAVDLCSGSGAVAIAMATEAPATQVTAVELSAEAWAYGLRNGAGRGIDMRCGDIEHAADDLAGCVHVVTANPPYIPLSAYESVAVEARDFDPALALWSGEDGLDAIAVVAEVAARLLVEGGLVLCEHADVQQRSAPAVFAATGDWTRVRDHPDLTGRPRFVSARRSSRSSSSTGTMAS